jgi:hypothetical protein
MMDSIFNNKTLPVFKLPSKKRGPVSKTNLGSRLRILNWDIFQDINDFKLPLIEDDVDNLVIHFNYLSYCTYGEGLLPMVIDMANEHQDVLFLISTASHTGLIKTDNQVEIPSNLGIGLSIDSLVNQKLLDEFHDADYPFKFLDIGSMFIHFEKLDITGFNMVMLNNQDDVDNIFKGIKNKYLGGINDLHYISQVNNINTYIIKQIDSNSNQNHPVSDYIPLTQFIVNDY